MKMYRNEGNRDIENLNYQVKKKTENKPYNLEQYLTALEKKLSSGFNPLYIEELMDVLRSAKK